MQARRQSTKPAAIDLGGSSPSTAMSRSVRSRPAPRRSCGRARWRRAEVAVKTFDAAKCGKAALPRVTPSSGAALLAASGGGSGGGRHPHIAHMLTEHATAAATHAVLEYCSGGSLQRHLHSKRRAATRGASAGSAAGCRPTPSGCRRRRWRCWRGRWRRRSSSCTASTWRTATSSRATSSSTGRSAPTSHACASSSATLASRRGAASGSRSRSARPATRRPS